MLAKTIAISGKVSHIERFSNTSGSVEGSTWSGYGGVSGEIRTDERTTFRINAKPVTYPGTPSLVEGEEVTLVVKNGRRQKRSLALKNHSTGLTYITADRSLITNKEVIKALLLILFLIVSGLSLAFDFSDFSVFYLVSLFVLFISINTYRKKTYTDFVYKLLKRQY